MPSFPWFLLLLPSPTHQNVFILVQKETIIPPWLACLPSFVWLPYLTNVCIYVGTEWLLTLTTLATNASQVSDIFTYSNKLKQIPTLQHTNTPTFQHIPKNSNNTPRSPRFPRHQHFNKPTHSNKLQQYSNTLQHYNIPTLQHTNTPTHSNIPTHSKFTF